MKRRWLLYIGLFAVGIGLPVTAGLFSKGVSKGESTTAVLRFPQATGSAKPAVVDIANFGSVKKGLQPWRFRIYVRVQNDSDRPRKVRVVLESCSVPIDWHARDYTWDESGRQLEEPLLQGKQFGIYLFVRVPKEMRNQPIVCNGVLRALDAESEELLAVAPMRIVNSAMSGVAAGVAEGHEGGHHHDGALHN